jgi:hypothetical protein
VQAGGPDESTSSSSAAITAGPRADEATRVESFLDAQYRAADVRHSFHSAMGDDIDCVDFEAEPGVRRMLARGVSREDLLRKPEMPAELAAGEKTVESVATFNGEPDENGRERACPAGTVPHVRITSEQIAQAGGIDAFQRALHTKVFPGNPGETQPPGPNLSNYAWTNAGWGGITGQGGTTTIAIASPAVPSGNGDHSLAQLWNTAGTGGGLQTVEVGWNVDHSLYGTSNAPHLFIYSTADDYNTTGCYNNVGSSCLTWVPYSGATIAPGATLPSSTPGGTQHEITLTVEHTKLFFCILGKPCNPPWSGWSIWATIDGGSSTLLGTYQQADYGTGGLASGATGFTFGSEVYDATGNFSAYPPDVVMGENGMMFGIAQYGYQAYHHTFGYYNSGYSLVTTGYATPSSTQGAYSVNTTAAAGNSTWNNWYYFGDWVRPIIIRL